MRVIEISSFYNHNKIMEFMRGLQKGNPFIILAKNGNRLFVTHGNKNGEISFQKEFEGLYDEILCCWKDTNEINYVTFREINDVWYFIQAPTSELSRINNTDIIQTIQSGLSE